MNIIRMIRYAIVPSVLALIALPQAAIGHGFYPPDGSVMMILEEYRSGPYIIEASHYRVNDFVILEVHLGFPDGQLPEDTQVEIAATWGPTEQSIARRLPRYQDAFIARLPLIDEAWQVAITVEGEAGSGAADVKIMPYREVMELSPLVRYLIFGTPFIFALIVLIGYRRFGISLLLDVSPMHTT